MARCYPPANSADHINVGLFGIAARRDCPFHPKPKLPQTLTRLCCSNPHLTVERRYLLRCPLQSGRSSSAAFPPLHQRRPSELHICIILRATSPSPIRLNINPRFSNRNRCLIVTDQFHPLQSCHF